MEHHTPQQRVCHPSSMTSGRMYVPSVEFPRMHGYTGTSYLCIPSLDDALTACLFNSYFNHRWTMITERHFCSCQGTAGVLALAPVGLCHMYLGLTAVSKSEQDLLETAVSTQRIDFLCSLAPEETGERKNATTTGIMASPETVPTAISQLQEPRLLQLHESDGLQEGKHHLLLPLSLLMICLF